MRLCVSNGVKGYNNNKPIITFISALRHDIFSISSTVGQCSDYIDISS